MSASLRRTVIVADRLALRARRLVAARAGQHGLQIMTMEQLALRLTGGFVRGIDVDSLRLAIQAALPGAALGELDAIKRLPGMVSCAAGTLGKVWLTEIDLPGKVAVHPRLAAMAALEEAVLAELPEALWRPAQIASAALARLQFAPALVGNLDIDGLADVAPCWRALLTALTGVVKVRWLPGARAVPGWVAHIGIAVARKAVAAPAVQVISAANPAHESLEAMRWVRQLLASGRVQPHDIAIASCDPSRFDTHLLALSAESAIDLHVVHGVPVTSTRDGQAACALADILVRGLTQERLRRLLALCDASGPLLQAFPAGWLKVLPADAGLATAQSWQRLLRQLQASDWPDGQDHGAPLAILVDLLGQGPAGAATVGPLLLKGRALAFWRQALVAGAAASLLATLARMQVDDGLDPCASVAWMPVSALAGTPRRYIRLLGLNAGHWPRASAEDPLLPDHVLARAALEPRPLSMQDADDFQAVLGACEGEVVLSFSRRNEDGRSLGVSPLLANCPAPRYLGRHAIAAHALSETDRLTARADEFHALARGARAAACWSNWQLGSVTAHDGAVRPSHARLLAIAGRTHSASSLQRLLRNPLGYLWEYGFGWQAPELSDEPLLLDGAASGNLVHQILERSLRLMGPTGLAGADAAVTAAAVQEARALVSDEWAVAAALPPAVVWRAALDEASDLARDALAFGRGELEGMMSYGEVVFGSGELKPGVALPWDPAAPVVIPGTTLRITGSIDRLDVSADGQRAIVRDYKTGKPLDDGAVLDGGAELQRCLYAHAVKAMLGEQVQVQASLAYPREKLERQLDDPGAAIVQLTGYLAGAHASLLAGHCLPGPDTAGKYDKFAFLLPANARATYCQRKAEAIRTVLGDAAAVWESK